MRRIAILAALTALVCVSGAYAQDLAELEGDHNVKSDLLTPHTDWATPYALGRTRVLFFMRGHGVEPREAIELGQRFDLDFQMVFWARIVDSTKEGWHGGENGLRRMDRLLSQKWDAFVFLGVPLERVPTEQQYKLLKQVADGAGLVLRGGDDKRVLKDKNRLPELPAFLGDVPEAVAFSVKQGRGLRLAAQPKIEYAPGWEAAYDEWAMRLGKAVLWAAGKAPQATLTLTATSKEIARERLPAKAVTLKWAQVPANCTALLTLRRDDGLTMATIKEALTPGAGEKSVTLPLVRAGSYTLDAICRDAQAVQTFAALPLTVTSERTITGVTLDRDWGEIGEKLTGKVTCTGNLTDATERLRVSLYDPTGRELLRRELGPVTTEGAFNFPLESWLPMLVTVRATLLAGEAQAPREIASAWTFANVVKRNRGQFNFLIWDLPNGTLAPYAEKSLADNAMTLQLGGTETPPKYVAANNVAWVPYTTHIHVERNADGTMKPSCWNDDAKLQAQVDTTVQKYTPSRQHGVFVYSLGDEIDVRGSCPCQYCLAAYQRYLQQQYGNIAALNTSWGTRYDTFEQITLSKPDDNNEMEAFRAGNFPRWYDRQAFQSDTFLRLCDRYGKGFRTLDPQSRCGFEGAGTFGAGDDLDGFIRTNTFWSPYPGTADEVVRSIAPRDFPRANWMGYTKDPETLLEKYWRMVTRGTDAVWWWRWDCIGSFHGWLSPTLDPYPTVKEILRDTQIVRDGLGDLLLHSQLQDDAIGMMFSQPSAYATKAQNSPSFGAYEGDHSAWHNTLRDLGYNFRYFTDRQLRLGEVDLTKFKVVILPLTQALGPQEAQALREYVQQGGTLVADARPGLYDGHCKPLPTGALDEVFGVKRTGYSDAVITEATFRLPNQPELAIQRLRVDSGLEAAGATAAGSAGKTPLLLTNPFGKGTAILLNFPLASFPSLMADTTPEAAALVPQSCLRAAGDPALQLRNAKGDRLRSVEVTRWTNGASEIVSLFRHSGLREDAAVTWPQARYVYDLKNRKSLGLLKTLKLSLTPCRAQFFALSPTPFKPVAVKSAATATRGSLVTVALQSALPVGQQAVRVQVRQPDGQIAPSLTQVVVVDRKGTTVELPLAFNDPAGKWTVTATELYTNQTGGSQFVVK